MEQSGKGIVTRPADDGPHWLLRGLLGLTALHLLALHLHVPLYRSFYPFTDKPAGDVLSLGLIAMAAAALLALLRARLQGARFLLAVVLIGVALQHGFALTEGRGLEALRECGVTTGHGELAAIADATPDAFALVRDYEDLARQGRLGYFAPSKPPGTLLLYIATDRLAALFGEDGLAANTMTALWPVFAAAAVVPLYLLASMLFGVAVARLAAAFYVAAPSLNLIQLHADQAFFPALFCAGLLALVAALRRQQAGPGHEAHALAAGAALYAVAYFQLPLVLAGTVSLAMMLAAQWSRDGRASLPMPAIELHVLAAVGFVLAALPLYLWLDYSPVERYANAIAFHAALKGSRANMVMAGLSNLIEFLAWTGVPLVGLLAAGLWRAWGQWRSPEAARLLGLAAALGLLLVYFAFFTRTAGEVPRLWLFLLPLICIAAARGAGLLGWEARSRPVALLLVGELLTTWFIKMNQDFA